MKHKFVRNIPDVLEENTLYISWHFGTIAHKCCCGCGEEVVTPLSPTDWTVSYNGRSVSLYPSIGNWSFKCQSHYWIENSQVIWAKKWSKEQIEDGRKKDILNKQIYYQKQGSEISHINKKRKYISSIFSKVRNLFFKK